MTSLLLIGLLVFTCGFANAAAAPQAIPRSNEIKVTSKVGFTTPPSETRNNVVKPTAKLPPSAKVPKTTKDDAVKILTEYETAFKADNKELKSQYMALITDTQDYLIVLSSDLSRDQKTKDCIYSAVRNTTATVALRIDVSLLGRALQYHTMRVKLTSKIPNQAQIDRILDLMNPISKFNIQISKENAELSNSLDMALSQLQTNGEKCLNYSIH